MFILKSEVEFDLAHFLNDHKGKCKNIHGHRYKLIVKVKNSELGSGENRGMVIDFKDLKTYLKKIKDYYDHKLIIEDIIDNKELIDFFETQNTFDILLCNYRPTAEEMSRDIYNKLKNMGLDIYEVELFETPTNSCIYREE